MPSGSRYLYLLTALGIVIFGWELLAYNESDLAVARCNCRPEVATLDSCPSKMPCVNIKNHCSVTLWAVVTSGSPATVWGSKRLAKGETIQFVLPSLTVTAGRIYLYYKDPVSFGQEPYTAFPVQDDPSNDYAQLLEFTFGVRRASTDNVRTPFVDYDISYVDAAALPILMNSPGALGSGTGPFPGRPNHLCKMTYNTCPLSHFYNSCPTFKKSIVSDISVAQCISSHHLCNLVSNGKAEDVNGMCAAMDRFKPMLMEGARCPSCTIYGCVLDDRGRNGNLTADSCAAINRGLCQSPENCPPPSHEDPSTWYRSDPLNSYASWLSQSSYNVFTFSLDDIVGNVNCASKQLDVFACPKCLS